MKIWIHRTELILFLLLWLSYGYFYQSTHHNEAARFDQMRAIVQDHVLEINKYWWNTADVIHYPKNGSDHIYPNKAPGMTLLGIVPFAAISAVLGVFYQLGLVNGGYWHLVTYLTTLFSVSLLSALAAVAIYRALRQMKADAYLSILAVIGIWLGTLAFPYSTLFFSHQFVASLLAITFFLLFRLRSSSEMSGRGQLWRAFGAGSLISLSVASEYPTALIAIALSIYALWTVMRSNRPPRQRLMLCTAGSCGALVGAVLLLAYNVAAFGKPFYIPYESYATVGASFSGTYRHGWLGLHWQGFGQFIHALAAVTVYPKIGMLYLGIAHWRIYACNPLLWLCLPGLAIMIWRRDSRPEGILVAAMTAVYLLFITHYGASEYDWSGASYVGSRHLIPLLPFLGLPLCFCLGIRALRFGFYPLFAVSLFYMLISTATEPRVGIPYENPARDLLVPDYLRARFAQNTDGLFAGQRELVKQSAAFNLGQLAGLSPQYQLWPLLAWWLLAGTVLLGSASRKSTSADTPSGDAEIANKKQRRALMLQSGMLLAFLIAMGLPPAIHHAAVAARNPQQGLRGKYFRNANWEEPAVEEIVDAEVNFDWTRSLPLPPPFSIEWTGQITIKQNGRYEFALIADDGALLEIDGRVVVDVSQGPILQKKSGSIDLTSGRHPVRVRYFNALFGGLIKLWWTPPGRSEEIVPSEVLVPAPPAVGQSPSLRHGP